MSIQRHGEGRPEEERSREPEPRTEPELRPSPEPKGPGGRGRGPGAFRRIRRVGWFSGRTLLAFGIVLVILVVAAIINSFFVDEPLRRQTETRMNQKLHGYTVQIPRLHFSLFGASVTAFDVRLRQQAHPEPPIMVISRMYAHVQWRELLTGHVVGTFVFDRPRLRLNLPELQSEQRDPVKVKDKGWQDALMEFYPLKINHFTVNDGDVLYLDVEPGNSLHLSNLDFEADNIRNIHSQDHVYPSPVHARTDIFKYGHAKLDGNANFLAEPFPGFHTIFHVESVPLDTVGPLLARGGMSLRGGTLSANGDLEYAPVARSARISDVTIRGTRLDILHTPGTANRETTPKKLAKEVATEASQKKSGMRIEVKNIKLADCNIGYVDRTRSPGYRIFISDADMNARNFSNQYAMGPSSIQLTGKFMGSGSARASATLRSEKRGAAFALNAAIDNTQLTGMNDVLQTYGRFKVLAGTFSLYSQVAVKDNQISGYIKPFFKGLKIDDKDKSFSHMMYKKFLGVMAQLLKNRRGEVATVATLSGPASSPRQDVLHTVFGLLGNAFIQALLPGFDRQLYATGQGPKPKNPPPPLPPAKAPAGKAGK